MIIEIYLRCRFCSASIPVVRQDGETDVTPVYRHMAREHRWEWSRLRRSCPLRRDLLTTSAREQLMEQLMDRRCRN